MTKTNFALVSLVAAIPGGVLAALMVMTFLQKASNLSGMMWGLTGLTFTISLLMALMPVGVLVFMGGSKKSKANDEEDVEEAGAAAAVADVDEDDLEAEEDELTAGAGDEFDLGDDDAATLGSDFDDVFEEEDDLFEDDED